MLKHTYKNKIYQNFKIIFSLLIIFDYYHNLENIYLPSLKLMLTNTWQIEAHFKLTMFISTQKYELHEKSENVSFTTMTDFIYSIVQICCILSVKRGKICITLSLSAYGHEL